MTTSTPSSPALTEEQMKARIQLLSDEIDANEEENRVMQEEITNLYKQMDAMKEPA